jgi:hypothetical protein
MPPKRTKNAPPVPKTQGRLNFQRLQKPQTTVSPLVQILSQYQLMIMVTDQLSSADIIYLIATCKEIKMYLTDDETIYASIKEKANCDGKGIEARAKCFGHWKGDITKATAQCEGSNCKPCDDCSAMVCNASAFRPFLHLHFSHPSGVPLSHHLLEQSGLLHRRPFSLAKPRGRLRRRYRQCALSPPL